MFITSSSAQFSLASGEHAAHQKKEKYKALAQRHQCEFLALSCETFGGLSESAIELITSLVYSSPDHGGQLTKGQLTFSIFNAIAAAIVNGNWSIYKHMRNQTIMRAASGFEALWRVGRQQRQRMQQANEDHLLQLASVAIEDNIRMQSVFALPDSERESIHLNEAVAVV